MKKLRWWKREAWFNGKPALWGQWHPDAWGVAFNVDLEFFSGIELFMHCNLGPVGVSFRLPIAYWGEVTDGTEPFGLLEAMHVSEHRKIGISLRERLELLLEDGWFNSWRTANETARELQSLDGSQTPIECEWSLVEMSRSGLLWKEFVCPNGAQESIFRCVKPVEQETE